MHKLSLDTNRLKHLYNEEMLSHAEIAQALGCSTSAITKYVKKLGLTRDRTAISQEHRRQRIIRTNRLKYKGDDWPRYAGKFKSLFPTDKCGWIRCPDPTHKATKWSVDHNHNCSRHGDYKYVNRSAIACRYCVRAYVHHSCNIIIEHWEWAQREGLTIPDDVAEYLAIGI
jgi:hypothetical protein